MGHRRIKIAIDGPAASGKSTTAREVARRLGYLYIDSGAMYRAVTLMALRAGVSTSEDEKVADIAAEIKISFRPNEERTEIYVNGEDVSRDIRTPQITANINPVAANFRVREILVEKQQELGKSGGVVMDGRDITTVVFPDAELKIFMNASPEERANRRVSELAGKKLSADYNAVLSSIKERDTADFTRAHGPLKQAADAVVIDTTLKSIEDQCREIYDLAMAIIEKNSSPEKN